MTRWGVIGASRFALDRMVPAIARSGDVVGVWSRSREAAERLATPYRAAVYDDLGQMIAKGGLDLAYVSTTATASPSILERLINARIPTLCEKPVAARSIDVERLAQLAADRGVQVAVNHHLRANDRVTALRGAIGTGDLGTIVSVSITNHQRLPLPAGWRTDDAESGGVLRDLTIHDLDLIQHLLARVEVARARATEWSGAVEVGVRVDGRAGDVVITLDDRWLLDPSDVARSALIVHGTRGTAVLQPAVTAIGSLLTITVDGVTTVSRQLNDAYEDTPRLAASGDQTLTPLTDAAHTARLVEAAVNEVRRPSPFLG